MAEQAEENTDKNRILHYNEKWFRPNETIGIILFIALWYIGITSGFGPEERGSTPRGATNLCEGINWNTD